MKNNTKLFIFTAAALMLLIAQLLISMAPAAVYAQESNLDIEVHRTKSIENVKFDFDIDRVEFQNLDDSGFVIDVFNQDGNEGKLVFGGTYTLHSGETLTGDLVVMGGKATLEQNSIVKGAVVVFGGAIQADGVIEEELVTFGGNVDLGEEAEVRGDVVSFGGKLNYEDETQFGGDVISDIPIPFEFSYSGDFDFSEISFPQFASTFNPVHEVLWFFFRIFMWTAVAVLMLLFLHKPVQRVSSAAVEQPVIAGGLGLFTAIIAPIILVLLAITLICLPVSLILIVALAAAWVLGIVALGYETGKRISIMLDQSWAPAVSAGLGTLILTFVINGIGLLIPCVGWIVPFLVGAVGLGAVILTRFGSQTYPPVYPESRSDLNLPEEDSSPGQISEEVTSLRDDQVEDFQSAPPEGE